MTTPLNLGVLRYLREMKPQLVKAVLELLPEELESDKLEEMDLRSLFIGDFVPNVLMHHELMSGAPIVFEANPSYGNLFGRVEYSSEQGRFVYQLPDDPLRRLT